MWYLDLSCLVFKISFTLSTCLYLINTVKGFFSILITPISIMGTAHLILHRQVVMLKEAYLFGRNTFMILFQREYFSVEQFATWAQHNDGQISNSGFEFR